MVSSGVDHFVGIPAARLCCYHAAVTAALYIFRGGGGGGGGEQGVQVLNATEECSYIIIHTCMVCTY